MGTSDRLALTRNRTFIESSLLHHAVATYNHLLSKEKHELAKVTKAASNLSKIKLGRRVGGAEGCGVGQGHPAARAAKFFRNTGA